MAADRRARRPRSSERGPGMGDRLRARGGAGGGVLRARLRPDEGLRRPHRDLRPARDRSRPPSPSRRGAGRRRPRTGCAGLRRAARQRRAGPASTTSTRPSPTRSPRGAPSWPSPRCSPQNQVVGWRARPLRHPDRDRLPDRGQLTSRPPARPTPGTSAPARARSAALRRAPPSGAARCRCRAPCRRGARRGRRCRACSRRRDRPARRRRRKPNTAHRSCSEKPRSSSVWLTRWVAVTRSSRSGSEMTIQREAELVASAAGARAGLGVGQRQQLLDLARRSRRRRRRRPP